MDSICTACGTGNREGRRFCARCGAPLAGDVACPACGAANEPGERFCGDCGTALVDETTTSAAAPASLAASTGRRPRRARWGVEGERKQLTVLFADVSGSMDLQEDLDPEMWAGIVGRLVEILAEGVRRFGGTVDTFTGDGIMALFGAPVAYEDHARRACHAAWHLTEAVGSYAEKLRADRGVDLHVRLGLNSGEVVVGRVGETLGLDPTVLGHTVGLAQRMEALAEPGRTLLTEHTARLVEGWFRLAEVGPVAVKGARDPVRVLALEGPAPAPPVLRGSSALGVSPLVGRDRELAVLEDALASAIEGRAQVVGVVGEAGVGKSRLGDEFARSAAARGITVRRTTGFSHAQEVPLLPVLALLRDYFSITPADDPAQARHKLTGRLLDLDPDLDESLPLICDFLEVPDPARPAPNLAPEVRMRRIFEVLRRVTQRRSQRETLVLVVEDLHWFDPQSRAFLEQLIPSFPGTRTLVLTNFRPEFTPPWAAHSYYRQVPLAPLDVHGAEELLNQLLGPDRSLAPLVGLIGERTGGNPFFIEEVVRSLAEDGTLAGDPGDYRLTGPLQDLRVPPTVQATLAARIDRLEETDRRLLRTAAVIGRNFTEPVLRLVADGSEGQIAGSLQRLCMAEFLQRIPEDPEEEYRFWHPLTQDVAHQGLLRTQRTRLHAAVARAIITTEPGRLSERAALIATHFERAGDHLEAARWNDRASMSAMRHDWSETLRRCRAALDHLERLTPGDEFARLGIHVRSRLMRYQARTGMSLGEAKRLYEASRALAEGHGDPALLARAQQAYAVCHFYQGAIGEGRALVLEAAQMAAQTNDVDISVACWTAASLWAVWSGPVRDGFDAAERVNALSGGDPDCGLEVMGFGGLSLTQISLAYLWTLEGQFAKARQWADRSAESSRGRSELEWLSWTLSLYPLISRTDAEVADGLACAREAVRLAEESGIPSVEVIALGAVGLSEIKLGRLEASLATLGRALTEARTRRVALFEGPTLLIYLAWAHEGLGDAAAALSFADEAKKVARRQGARVPECLALLTRGRVRRSHGDAGDSVRADLDAALALARGTGALAYESLIDQELAKLDHGETELRG